MHVYCLILYNLKCLQQLWRLFFWLFFFFFVALVLIRLHRHPELSWGVITQTLFPLQMELAARDVPGHHVACSIKAKMSEYFLLQPSGKNTVIAVALVQPCMARTLCTLG